MALSCCVLKSSWKQKIKPLNGKSPPCEMVDAMPASDTTEQPVTYSGRV